MTDNGNKNNNKNITNDLSNNKLLKQIYNKNQLLLKINHTIIIIIIDIKKIT